MKTLDQFSDTELSEDVLCALQDIAGDEILSSSDKPTYTLKPTKQDVLNLFLRGNRLDWNYYTNYGLECGDSRIDLLLNEIYTTFNDTEYLPDMERFNNEQRILFYYITAKFALQEEQEIIAKLQNMINGNTRLVLEKEHIN